MKQKERRTRASLVLGLLSGVLYGLWAFWANYDRIGIAAFLPASVQFGLSFFATSVLSFSMDWILLRSTDWFHRMVAALAPINLLASVFAIAHWIAGTPHVFKTIAPSYIIGTLFCILFVLSRTKRFG